MTKQFYDYLISQDLDPYSMSEEEKKTHKDSYKQELYPGSATEPGSIVNTLTSNNPTEAIKAKIVIDTVAGNCLMLNVLSYIRHIFLLKQISTFSAANENEHVNNLLESTADTTPDWEINVRRGKWSDHQTKDDKCGPQWYGFNGNADVGSISTTLYKSSKCGRLDFGNCWHAGTVRAYLAGELIGEAGPNTPSKIIEFPIPENSQLEIKDEGAHSIIKFTNFEMVDCSGKFKLAIFASSC